MANPCTCGRKIQKLCLSIFKLFTDTTGPSLDIPDLYFFESFHFTIYGVPPILIENYVEYIIAKPIHITSL